jgi:glycosyltransferase involved in cell wall biosynthesis
MATARTIALWAFICRPPAGSEDGIGWTWAQAHARSGHDVHLVTMPTFQDELEAQLSKMTAPGSVTVHFTKADDRESIRTTTVKHLSRRLPSARRTASRSHLLLAGNPASEALARQLGAQRVERMLSEGIDESLLAPEVRGSQHSHEQLVLWVGRFFPVKGAPLAVEAFDHVRRAVPTARLVMVGDGVTQAETQRRAHALGLSEAVEFTDKLDWPSVIRLYDQADVLMFTSIRDSSTATGMEAAARGLPIVALTHSGAAAATTTRTSGSPR